MLEMITDIREVWAWVAPGLEAIQRKTRPDWSIEDVRNMCASGKWQLFVDREAKAFGIACLYEEQFSGIHRLSIECAYHAGDEDIVAQYMPFWLELAGRMGAKEIEVRSPRKGWERKGFKPVGIVYRMEV